MGKQTGFIDKFYHYITMPGRQHTNKNDQQTLRRSSVKGIKEQNIF